MDWESSTSRTSSWFLQVATAKKIEISEFLPDFNRDLCVFLNSVTQAFLLERLFWNR